MLPWVVLGVMLIVGFLISVIYNGVKFLIDGFLITGLVWLILGPLCCGKYHLTSSTINSAAYSTFNDAFHFSSLCVHVVRGIQPLHSFARREQTGQIQPSTIQTISVRMNVEPIHLDDDDDEENENSSLAIAMIYSISIPNNNISELND